MIVKIKTIHVFTPKKHCNQRTRLSVLPKFLWLPFYYRSLGGALDLVLPLFAYLAIKLIVIEQPLLLLHCGEHDDMKLGVVMKERKSALNQQLYIVFHFLHFVHYMASLSSQQSFSSEEQVERRRSGEGARNEIIKSKTIIIEFMHRRN